MTWLTSAGVTLKLDGDTIVHRGPRRALGAEVLAKLGQHKAEIVAKLQRQAEIGSRCFLGIAESNGWERGEVDPGEASPGSWPALAAAHRERILNRLSALPPASNEDGRRLRGLTRSFLETEHWQTAVALGWSLIELFGIDPHAPLTSLDGQGLVTGLALSRLKGGHLENIAEDQATIRCRSGSLLTYRRGSVGFDDAVLWWECPALIGSPEHAQ